MTLDPIEHAYELRCTPEAAFDVYTGRIGEWWPPDYSANPETLESVVIEPGVGGRLLATHSVEGEFIWGQVTTWVPARKLVHTFTLAMSPADPSEVDVEFEPHDGGCRLRFQHGGWTEANASYRDKYGDWPLILDRFATLAEGRSGQHIA